MPDLHPIWVAHRIYGYFLVKHEGLDSRIQENPNVAKVGGLQSRGVEGEAVVHLLRALDNEGSGVLRLSRRVKKMA